MRHILTISVLVLSIEGVAQQDSLVKAVEREFRVIYAEFAKERGLSNKLDAGLDTVADIQLAFLSGPDQPYLTHRNADEALARPEDRMRAATGRNVPVGEILVQIPLFVGEHDARELAKAALKSWYDSIGHRRIMTDRRYTHYSFRFALNHFGRINGAGVFVEETDARSRR
jgi:hypothetical protein